MRKFFAMVALNSEHSMVVMTSQPRENSSGKQRCPAGQGNVLSQCRVIHVSGKALANILRLADVCPSCSVKACSRSLSVYASVLTQEFCCLV